MPRIEKYELSPVVEIVVQINTQTFTRLSNYCIRYQLTRDAVTDQALLAWNLYSTGTLPCITTLPESLIVSISHPANYSLKTRASAADVIQDRVIDYAINQYLNHKQSDLDPTVAILAT